MMTYIIYKICILIIKNIIYDYTTNFYRFLISNFIMFFYFCSKRNCVITYIIYLYATKHPLFSGLMIYK